ncbi:MAG: hypothetical protein P1U34_11775 [Coxiellaceae bacterium]|nr:hypothetical protein [Coxiellaceae bacterium]
MRQTILKVSQHLRFKSTVASSKLRQQICGSSTTAVDFSKTLVARIEARGALTPMPEFEPAVIAMLETLESDKTQEQVDKQGELAKEMVCHAQRQLLHLTLQFRGFDLDYNYKPTYGGQFPYIPSMMTIANVLALLDALTRQRYDGLPMHYHVERYLYRMHEMHHLPSCANSKPVFLPVLFDLSLVELIQVRPLQLGLVGVLTDEAVFADGHFNPPSDFFFHDFSHLVRMVTFNEQARAGESVSACINKEAAFLHEKLLPAIKVTADDSYHDRNIKQLMTVLLFEIFHESAFAVNREQIAKAFAFESGDAAPFEYMSTSDFPHERLEILRCKTANLVSGSGLFSSKDRVEVRRFMDTSPNFLANAYHRLHTGFYDRKEARADDLPAMEQRSAYNIAEAALRVADICLPGHSYTLDQLKAKAVDRRSLEGYPGDDTRAPSIKPG